MVTDPTDLYRIRDGVYAPDLLIVAVVELDLFSWLADRGPITVNALAGGLGLAGRPADVLVTYLAARGLLARSGDRGDPGHDTVTLTGLARDHLVTGSPFDLRAYYASLRDRPACRELHAVLRTGRPADWASAPAGGTWAGRLDDPAFAATITDAMDARSRFLAPALVEAVRDLPGRRVLDIGGGSGGYAAALADGLGITGSVLERPPVDGVTRTLLAARGHADRIDVVAGDMLADPLPTGYDLHLFSNVLHDWDAGTVRALLARSHTALAPGGYLVDHDTHVDRGHAGPLPAAEYSVLLMHSTLGKCWSVRELGAMLRAAGFVAVRTRPTAADRSVVIARKA